MRRLALLALVPFLTAALPTEWPVGTYIHDYQIELGATNHQDIAGPDPVQHPNWNGTGSLTPQQNKDAMMALVPQFAAGLPGGRQPSDLLYGTPNVGGCPGGNGSFTASNLAGLVSRGFKVTLPVIGEVPLIYECDYSRAFPGTSARTLQDGQWVVILHSATFGQIDLRAASTGGVISLESLHVGHNTGLQGVLYCDDSSSCFTYRSEVLIGSDIVKVGDNDTFIATHFHGYTDADATDPHADIFQFTGSSENFFLLDSNCEGPFRESQQCLRGNFANGNTAGPAYIGGNLMSGGRMNTGDSVGFVGGSGFEGGWTGPAVWHGNRFLGSDDPDIGISWFAGAPCYCGSAVPAGSCYASGNTAADGVTTSGTNGNGTLSDTSGYGGRGDDTWTHAWQTACEASNGSTQTVTAAQITTMDAERTKAAGYLTAAYAAVGLTAAATTTITGAVPSTGAPGQDVVVTFTTENFGDPIEDCDIAATGANTFSQDLSTPFSPATIPGASLANAGTTSITVTCDDNPPGSDSDTSNSVDLVFAAVGDTVFVDTDQKNAVGAIPYSFQVTGTITGTETGTTVVELDETCNGSWDNDVTVSSPASGDQTFAFPTPSEDAGPYSFSGDYCVRATRDGTVSPTTAYSVTVTGTPPQVVEVRVYDTTIAGCAEKKTSIQIIDNLMLDRDAVGAAPNFAIVTTEAPQYATYAGPSCVDVQQTDPTNGLVNRDETNDPFATYGDRNYCDDTLGIIDPTIGATGTDATANGAYKLTITPRDVESTGASCTGGNAGGTVDYDFRIADLTMVSVTPAIPNDTESFVVAYNESGIDCATGAQADCDGDGTYGDDVVDETAEEATCPALPVGIYEIGIGCQMTGFSGVVTETIPVTVIPAAAGSTVFKRPVRIVP